MNSEHKKIIEEANKIAKKVLGDTHRHKWIDAKSFRDEIINVKKYYCDCGAVKYKDLNTGKSIIDKNECE